MDMAIALKKYEFFVLSGFLILYPFYLWSSGYPQIADILLFGFALWRLPALISGGRGKINLHKPVLILGLFAGLTFLINALHYIFDHDIRFILSSLYYIYNALVFITMHYLFRNISENQMRVFIFLILAVLAAQLLMFPFLSESGLRFSGSFNNPNQLTYWSLLMCCIGLVLAQDYSIQLKEILLLVLATALIALTLSRIGLISIALVWLIVFFMMRKTQTAWILFLSTALITILGVGWLSHLTGFGGLEEITGGIIDRFQQQSDLYQAVWVNRGFERMIDQPFWLIFGAGEGGFDRFDVSGSDKIIELHSGLGTILFSYGIAGFFLFSYFLFLLARGATRLEIFLIGVLLIFSLSHQSFRFAMFWTVLGVLAAMQERRKNLTSLIS